MIEPFKGHCGCADADMLGVLWVESEQILLLKVDCLKLGPVRNKAICPSHIQTDKGLTFSYTKISMSQNICSKSLSTNLCVHGLNLCQKILVCEESLTNIYPKFVTSKN